jgi:ABC-type sugar transport system ATPase subunit
MGPVTQCFVVRGVYWSDAGTITLAREQLDITTIHQELPVAPALTTLDNVWISA